jgi:hypothetical protein
LLLGLMGVGMYWWWSRPATPSAPAPAPMLAPESATPAAPVTPNKKLQVEAPDTNRAPTAMDREFTRLLALAADHRADPAAGADAWAAFLNAYPQGDEQLLAAARTRLDKCLKDMNEMQIKQRPQLNKATPAAPAAPKRNDNEMDF